MPINFAAKILICDLLDGLKTSSYQLIRAPLRGSFLGVFTAPLPLPLRLPLSFIRVLPSVGLARLT